MVVKGNRESPTTWCNFHRSVPNAVISANDTSLHVLVKFHMLFFYQMLARRVDTSARQWSKNASYATKQWIRENDQLLKLVGAVFEYQFEWQPDQAMQSLGQYKELNLDYLGVPSLIS